MKFREIDVCLTWSNYQTILKVFLEENSKHFISKVNLIMSMENHHLWNTKYLQWELKYSRKLNFKENLRYFNL